MYVLSVLFTGLLSILEAQKLPTTPTFNPECGGMRRAAKHLKNGIQLYLKKTSNCQPNPHCTGEFYVCCLKGADHFFRTLLRSFSDKNAQNVKSKPCYMKVHCTYQYLYSKARNMLYLFLTDIFYI